MCILVLFKKTFESTYLCSDLSLSALYFLKTLLSFLSSSGGKKLKFVVFLLKKEESREPDKIMVDCFMIHGIDQVRLFDAAYTQGRWELGE